MDGAKANYRYQAIDTYIQTCADLGGSSNYSNENFEDLSGEGFLANCDWKQVNIPVPIYSWNQFTWRKGLPKQFRRALMSEASRFAYWLPCFVVKVIRFYELSEVVRTTLEKKREQQIVGKMVSVVLDFNPAFVYSEYI
ncbi:hypothetical protein POVWA2_098160 [Plasmodium ovale wallikeri]|uniref:Uncharacterized protein n=1 Tax=Plasmodium ovale wallikeri TaxID=864142 RepID=A0A1A9APK5_PLAOA|nr:hypothetical protein POVWA1_089040 [Plasmodium ovale wallikeri]SBT59584.1 hypothetical protein POVWA2_098160 [Plasmodium ovale wallikeri]